MLYEAAIRSAREKRFCDEALANELTARFYAALHFGAILHALDKSARKLGVDRLDLLLLHQASTKRALDESRNVNINIKRRPGQRVAGWRYSHGFNEPPPLNANSIASAFESYRASTADAGFCTRACPRARAHRW
jgi:hypothetical protein